MENNVLPPSGSILGFLLMSGVSFFVGGFLSLLFVIALLIKWIRRSNWRTLPAFASLIDITIGTTVLFIHPNVFSKICNALGYNLSFGFTMFWLSVYFNCLLFSCCWSFCLPIAVYKELKETNRPIHYGKTIITALTIGIFVLVKVVAFGLEYCIAMHNSSMNSDLQARGIVVNGIVLISVIQHLFVIFKVNCNKTLLKRDSNNSMTLVKINLIKQLMTFLSTGLMALFFVSYLLHVAGQFIFCLRLVPLAIAALRYNPAAQGNDAAIKDVGELKKKLSA